MGGLIVVVIVLLAVVVVGLLVAAKLGLIKPAGAGAEKDAGVGDETASVPYKRRERLLSPAEGSFHSVLRQALPMLTEAAGKDEPPLVFAKVRLIDILEVDRSLAGDKWKGPQNKITSKHVDFVLCDPSTTRPLLLVELDDASHQRSDRKARDEFVDRAAKAAGVPVLHVKAAAGYSPRGLAAEMGRVLGVGVGADNPAPPRAGRA